MLYVALAGLSLALALGAFSREASAVSKSVDSFEISQFVESLNERLMGGSAGGFSAFLPPGICNSTVSGTSLLSAQGAFYLVRPVAVVGNALCPDGTSVALSVRYNGASAYLSRG
jgi:hypothetical protein